MYGFVCDSLQVARQSSRLNIKLLEYIFNYCCAHLYSNHGLKKNVLEDASLISQLVKL